MEKDRKILKKAELAKVSGGDKENTSKTVAKVTKKKGTSCSMCGSENVKREQRKHYIIRVTCKDCGYQYQYPGILED